MSSHPTNEPVLNYEPGSKHKSDLKNEIDKQLKEILEIPCIVNGREVYTNNTVVQVVPHNHKHILANVHLAGKKEIKEACESAVNAQTDWIALGMEKRAQIFEKCAELLANEWRMKINAATMLNQSKTAFQAEVDAACELIDFWRFNAHYAREFHDQLQPLVSPEGTLNTTEIRPLEGFILAITPFNFTSIAANLPSAPALVGCTAIWKPSRNSYYSNYLLMQLMMEAGLPNGVINFLPGSGAEITETALANPDFAGIHFTGSTNVFQGIWQRVAQALPSLKGYPRIVGETGGKDFVVAHPDCDQRGLTIALLRGAFEYQGQKCSAASRAYIPNSVWDGIENDLISEINKIKIGDCNDFTNFMTAVIDEKAFNKITGYIERAKNDTECSIVVGGGSDNSKGWFIEPTIILAKNPDSETMVEEIFGPVLTVYIYQDEDFDNILDICDKASPYALTGSIFSSNEENIQKAYDRLRFTAGNFYINDKPTGAVVAQQPFGGARASGTNDKAGGPLNLLRWISPRSVKRNNLKIHEWEYPFMDES
ncbi:MAG: 1-pyrroline-5-carboxylate dehydrogenase [Euryarchaeota archaeon]|uniref:L-glutamate gamma-semialdehyde dehydrogenase n=1 Tax=Marine Group III euryarchaeote CG-Epi2 TaxID=1888996 RepID=A0A1J5TL51_9ARCH|nr:1-pyrroline-5-carboxylate dehydrogenase [Euryarchaeota archaeon]OIR21689.1 MAG: 1-pyrroline-5-carboxylate dehydrogenase [Marine Group III euryarchaeote CG-Epi2]|tara:strand:- start:6595 stop:8214 length:1620 start_codon:yes stop_codon:yes gene_type:complete